MSNTFVGILQEFLFDSKWEMGGFADILRAWSQPVLGGARLQLVHRLFGE